MCRRAWQLVWPTGRLLLGAARALCAGRDPGLAAVAARAHAAAERGLRWLWGAGGRGDRGREPEPAEPAQQLQRYRDPTGARRRGCNRHTFTLCHSASSDKAADGNGSVDHQIASVALPFLCSPAANSASELVITRTGAPAAPRHILSQSAGDAQARRQQRRQHIPWHAVRQQPHRAPPHGAPLPIHGREARALHRLDSRLLVDKAAIHRAACVCVCVCVCAVSLSCVAGAASLRYAAHSHKLLGCGSLALQSAALCKWCVSFLQRAFTMRLCTTCADAQAQAVQQSLLDRGWCSQLQLLCESARALRLVLALVTAESDPALCMSSTAAARLWGPSQSVCRVVRCCKYIRSRCWQSGAVSILCVTCAVQLGKLAWTARAALNKVHSQV